MNDRPRQRLGRLETLGAWLNLWTPPRDVPVPAVPWKALGITATVLVAGLVALALLVFPRVAADRDAAREREQRIAAERHAALLASVDREQQPHVGRGPRDLPADEPARRVRTRIGLITEARSAIARDAGERSARRILGVQCEPFPRVVDGTPTRELSRGAAAYDCVAVTSRFDTGASSPGGVIGMPFRLVAHFDSGRYAWCRIVPLGDRDRLSHPLPDACRLEPSGA